MIDRKVGNIGQGDFIKLCADAGLACGTSQGDDYAGWDFFVDFPLKQDKNILTNEDDRAIECKVQVKSSDNKNKSVQVKLSNLKRFCDSTVPCFFFIAEYNGKINPESIYLVHTGKDLIFKILKRLRENQVGDKLPLNKLTMSVPYGGNDKVSEFSGRALKEKIECYVKEGMNSYIKRKESQLKTLGYENSNYEMKFEVNSTGEHTSLMRAYLGYPEKVNIKNIVSWDKRFNIKLLQEELTQERATVEFLNVQPTTTGEIMFESNDEILSFSCEYYLSPLPKVPENAPILRAKCDNIDILFNNGNSGAKVTFLPPDKVISIFEMRDVFFLMKFLFMDENPVSLQLKKLDGDFISFTISDLDNKEYDYKNKLQFSLQIIENLIDIATRSRLESKIKLSMKSLGENAGRIIEVYKFLNRNFDSGNHKINLELEDDDIKIDLKKRVCIVFSITLFFELTAFSFIFSACGLMRNDERAYILDDYKLNFEKTISSRGAEDFFETIKKQLRLLLVNIY